MKVQTVNRYTEHTRSRYIEATFRGNHESIRSVTNSSYHKRFAKKLRQQTNSLYINVLHING